jgi:hypothetical protein
MDYDNLFECLIGIRKLLDKMQAELISVAARRAPLPFPEDAPRPAKAGPQPFPVDAPAHLYEHLSYSNHEYDSQEF